MKDKVSTKVLDTVAFFIAESIRADNLEIQKKVFSVHQVTPTSEDIDRVREEWAEVIEEYRMGGEKAVKKGISISHLPYASIYTRVKALGEIVKKCKDGYSEETATSKGEIVTLMKYDHNAAIKAIEATAKLVDTLEEQGGDEDEFETIIAQFDVESQRILRTHKSGN